MASFRNVSQSELCPVCGKPDWCSFMIPDEPVYSGHELCICRRTAMRPKEIFTSPYNNISYICIDLAKDGSCIYNQLDAYNSKKERRAQSRYKPVPKPNIIVPDPVEKPYPLLPAEKIDEIYRDFLNLLSLSSDHKKLLIKEGWTLQMIRESNIRSFNFKRKLDANGSYTDFEERIKICSKLLLKHESLIGVPGFYQTDTNVFTFVGKRGYVIPVYNSLKQITSLRLRKDKQRLIDGKLEGKYTAFSSYFVDNSRKNVYQNGTKPENNISLYFNESVDDPSTCYITEGEKKAFVTNKILQVPVISLPGVTSYNGLFVDFVSSPSFINYLYSIGTKFVVVAYDADKREKVNVLRSEAILVNCLLECNFEKVFIANWNPGFGKGMDDILFTGIRPTNLPVTKKMDIPLNS